MAEINHTDINLFFELLRGINTNLEAIAKSTSAVASELEQARLKREAGHG